jgi:hypothetical protein
MSNQEIPPVIGTSVKFSLSRREILFCRLWVITHNKILMGIMAVCCVVAPFYCLPDTSAFSPTKKAFFFVFFIVTMFCIMAVFQIVFQAVWLLLNKNRGVVGEHELEIRDDGLLEKSPVNESLHRWAGFHKIGASRNYFFIFVTDNNVQYVPLRCFPSREEARRFIEDVRRRVKTA